MALAFDSLAYAKHLENSGVSRKVAEAHAQAAREFIMTELATPGDIAASESRMLGRMEALELKLTIRLGGMLIVGFGALAALIKL